MSKRRCLDCRAESPETQSVKATKRGCRQAHEAPLTPGCKIESQRESQREKCMQPEVGALLQACASDARAREGRCIARLNGRQLERSRRGDGGRREEGTERIFGIEFPEELNSSTSHAALVALVSCCLALGSCGRRWSQEDEGEGETRAAAAVPAQLAVILLPHFISVPTTHCRLTHPLPCDRRMTRPRGSRERRARGRRSETVRDAG